MAVKLFQIYQVSEIISRLKVIRLNITSQIIINPLGLILTPSIYVVSCQYL